MVVYVEGDGHAVSRSGRISADPTPYYPVGWMLARQDTAPAVLYLARLGQYNPRFATAQYNKFWGEARFAQTIVQAMNHTLDVVKERLQIERIHLVGFSGGGAIACLLAARRNDVASLVTVCGLLDHAFWTRKNGYTPLSASLNAADEAQKVRHIPQIHFFGTNDSVITPDISWQFLHSAEFSHAERIAVEARHNSGWEQAWPALLSGKIASLRQTQRKPVP